MNNEDGKLICAVCRTRFQIDNADIILLEPGEKWRKILAGKAPIQRLLKSSIGSCRIGELPGMQLCSSLCKECFGKGEGWFLWFIINHVRGLVWAYTSGSRDAKRTGKKLTELEIQKEEQWRLWGSLIENHNQIGKDVNEKTVTIDIIVEKRKNAGNLSPDREG